MYPPSFPDPVPCCPVGGSLSHPPQARQGSDDKKGEEEERDSATSGKSFCHVCLTGLWLFLIVILPFIVSCIVDFCSIYMPMVLGKVTVAITNKC